MSLKGFLQHTLKKKSWKWWIYLENWTHNSNKLGHACQYNFVHNCFSGWEIKGNYTSLPGSGRIHCLNWAQLLKTERERMTFAVNWSSSSFKKPLITILILHPKLNIKVFRQLKRDMIKDSGSTSQGKLGYGDVSVFYVTRILQATFRTGTSEFSLNWFLFV